MPEYHEHSTQLVYYYTDCLFLKWTFIFQLLWLNICLRLLDPLFYHMYFIFLATESSIPVISLSDLEFEEILGEGGQGVVQRGRWISKGIDVAIKKITGRVNEREVSLTVVYVKLFCKHLYI